jgi:Fur family transcriptional regulator, ferric uptake regulator
MKIEKEFRFSPDASASVDEIMAVLVQAGYSNTRARRAVVAVLHESEGQASPAELLALGRVHHPALGLVTVYRTLEILITLGLVRKLHLDEGCHTYALSLIGPHGEMRGGDRHDHGHHVICRECGRAVEFEGCDLGVVVASVEAQTGFQVREHWLELFGVCPGCRGANQRMNEPANQ